MTRQRQRQRPRAATRIAPAILALALAACGTADESRGASPDQTDAASGETAAGEQVAQLLATASGASFGAVYELRDDGRVVARFEVDAAPPRFAITEGDEQGGVVGIRTAAGASINCAGAGDAWECVRLPEGDGDVTLAGWLATSVDVDADATAAGAWVPGPARDIAGREAVCGSGTILADEVAEVCLDRELGLPLWARYDGGRELEALEVGDPRASAFEPPVEPIDVDDWADGG